MQVDAHYLQLYLWRFVSDENLPENINYLQRKACHNFNIIAGMLSSGTYGKLVPEKMKFYAYDVNKNSFPRGIGELKPPPTDIDGTKMFSQNICKINMTKKLRKYNV